MTQSLMSIGWMLLALVLSASIGLERQIRGKSAGIRTRASSSPGTARSEA